ncbi:hypothetical protein MMC14_001461 [Varicellaria rhodocarpa]|nr:hypothetical protein [Varicellaria rhodocarpa]
MDAGRTSIALPGINFLDFEKVKGEKAEYGQNISSSAVTNMSAPALVSPSLYSGPPPPYSYPSSTASSVVGLTGYISPPKSRRTSDDDKDAPPPSKPQPPHRQSLPSIHEALGSNKSLPYTSTTTQSVSSPQTPHPDPIRTPSTPIPRSHPEAVLQGPPNPFAQGQPMPYVSMEGHGPRPHPLQITQPYVEAPPSRFSSSSQTENAPYPNHSKIAPSPTSPHRSSPHFSQYPRSSSMYTPNSHPTTMGSQHTYHVYNPPYQHPAQPPNIQPYQHQYHSQSHWHPDRVDFEQGEESRRMVPKGSPSGGKHYGESVKRHLDIFDLEASLNEIAEGSGRVLEFTGRFGARSHQVQRSGIQPSSLPTLNECDDIIKQQHKVLDAMARIRDVIINQQHALAEQRTRDEANKDPSEYGDDGPLGQDKSEGSGGFAGADLKKRRGRNAPPGRCHSCNRAETPEWRRGPDGARTLCNACGLHYAKLTRKMGSKAQVGSSNLRPKDNGQTSP